MSCFILAHVVYLFFSDPQLRRNLLITNYHIVYPSYRDEILFLYLLKNNGTFMITCIFLCLCRLFNISITFKSDFSVLIPELWYRNLKVFIYLENLLFSEVSVYWTQYNGFGLQWTKCAWRFTSLCK